jgi:hypothetical protein
MSPTSSGDPTPYLDAIQSALGSATDGADLADLVAAIVDNAELSLTGMELDAVYFGASVAVDSYDYWLTQGGLQAELAIFEQTYGSCLQLADEPNTCLYDSSARLPSLHAPPTLRRVSTTGGTMPSACLIDGVGVIEADFTGAVGTFIATLGNGGAALLGGGASSGAKGLWEFGKFLWCAYHS